jgi:uncharacterized protein
LTPTLRGDDEVDVEEALLKLTGWFLENGKKGVAVAFSGGVDSTLTAKVACNVLGNKAVAVTASMEFITKRELEEARRAATGIGIRHCIVKLDLPDRIKGNPPDRCYQCKKLVLDTIKEFARELGIKTIVDGTNYDDLETDRPGLIALKEEGVRSPLAELKMGKALVRELSKSLGLDYGKPSSPCLATRFPSNHRITAKELEIVGEAEGFIKSLGFEVVRVRFLDGLASIELGKDEIAKMSKGDNYGKTVEKLMNLGFEKVALDPKGYRAGSTS